jgi:hypothetical protein
MIEISFFLSLSPSMERRVASIAMVTTLCSMSCSLGAVVTEYRCEQRMRSVDQENKARMDDQWRDRARRVVRHE